MDKIVVMTHNPNKQYGDVRPLIEKENGYKKWKKSINVEKGQKVLIYVSGNSKRIEYIMEVENVYEDSMDLLLIEKLSEDKANKLKLNRLQENGFNNGTVNYILDNNKPLFNYVISVLNIKNKKLGNTDIKIKNIMLYGAPGVGKTYNYKKLISLIEGGDFSESEIFDFIVNDKDDEIEEKSIEKLYENIKKEKRMEFVTFHQSYSYEDFIEGFRPTENGNIELEDGIFKVICDKAKNQKKEILYQQISFDEAYDILRTKYIEDEIEKIYSVSNIEILIHDFKEKTIKVQSSKAKDSQYVKKSDLEIVVNAVLNDEVKKPSDIRALDVKKDTISLGGLYLPIARKIVDLIKNTKKNLEQKEKNFYIIIDEINRGNISKIFGELITLIEEDKRGKKEYEVTLPYSKEKFIIPENLYIIATMNSTDKSIATIDIALRRRFTFLKMEPRPECVTSTDAQNLMIKINEFIKYNRGEEFMLGHGYFMNGLDLEFIKEYKIKPLLEEYFYGDEENYKKAVEILEKEV